MVVVVVELPRPVRHPGRRGKGVVGEGLLGPTNPPVDDHQDEEQDEHEEDAADEGDEPSLGREVLHAKAVAMIGQDNIDNVVRVHLERCRR